MLRGDIESPSQLYHEIHSSFDARKDNKLDEAIISPYRTRSSSHQQSMHLPVVEELMVEAGWEWPSTVQQQTARWQPVECYVLVHHFGESALG